MKLAVFSDFVEENWPSMDLVADHLVVHLAHIPGIEPTQIRPRLPLVRHRPGTQAPHAALALGRYLAYPAYAAAERRRFDWFHVADHSYGHLALALPRPRVGVYCHDIDAFRPLLAAERTRTWRRSLARLLLAGLRCARVVFHSTPAVREEILRHGLVPAERLVHAPYGIAEEFRGERDAEDARLAGRPPYVLHVGSLIPRKNPEFLLALFVELARSVPGLELVQVGGTFTAEQWALLSARGVRERVRQLRGLERRELAALYRNAGAVLLPSRAEGFGLPVIEALSCGARVVASDLEVLRQVGGDAVAYVPVDDLGAFRAVALAALRGEGPVPEVRQRVVGRYTWSAHAATIAAAYASLARAER